MPGVRALVTGAAGFVGGHLVPALERAGYAVTPTDRELDVSDAGAVEVAVGDLRPDLVVHLAAVSSVAASRGEPELTYRVNFLGARSVLEAAARRVPGARLLLVGSGDQYGTLEPGARPWRESDPQRPRSPYARTKTTADLLGAEHARRGLHVVRSRSFNHTGPGQDERFVLASFAKQAVEIAAGRREPVLRVGNLESTRDFLDVEDVVAAYLALSAPDVSPGAYNVASGRPVRVRDALDEILRLAGAQARIEVDPERLRPTDASVGDATRLRECTGWKPRIALEETLERLVADRRARLNGA
jgi:GDP-4-dehydro-6-deoxy-D-mannose reductase